MTRGRRPAPPPSQCSASSRAGSLETPADARAPPAVSAAPSADLWRSFAGYLLLIAPWALRGSFLKVHLDLGQTEAPQRVDQRRAIQPLRGGRRVNRLGVQDKAGDLGPVLQDFRDPLPDPSPPGRHSACSPQRLPCGETVATQLVKLKRGGGPPDRASWWRIIN